VDASQTLPKVMSRAGYETFHVGKDFAEFTAALKAFDTSVTADDMTPELRRGTSERTADAAIKFLAGRSAESRPFYIYFAPPVPHDPRTAAPEFHARYSAAKIPLPAAFQPQHPWDNGEMIIRDELLAPWPRTPEKIKQQIADYYACVTGLDHHIGRVFAQLKASGEWDNTIIIFTGDNGLSLGEHGLLGKQNLYELGGMHVPCVIAGPGIPKGRSDALVYLMDLFPTFCDLVGAPVPDGVEGRNLIPIIHGKATNARDVLYTAYKDSQRALRDDRWKLIRYPLVDRTQLFDLSVDPHELNNLADDPAQAARIAAMTESLQQEMRRYADDAPLKVANSKPAAWSPPTSLPAAKEPATRGQKP
jgi:arylsulfatase A-like enzyme